MRATLDWSHELLHEPERELFRRLSVFAGGFTLEVTEDVCAAGAVEAAGVLVLLGAAEALLEAAGTHLYAQVDHDLHQRVVDAVRERLEEWAWKEARDEGRAMSFEEAVAYVREGGESLPTATTETPATE